MTKSLSAPSAPSAPSMIGGPITSSSRHRSRGSDHIGEPKYSVGLDLGQSKDFTALAVIEATDLGTGEWETLGHRPTLISPIDGAVLMSEPITQEQTIRVHHLRHLARFDLGTTYPKIVDHVTTLMAIPPLNDDAMLTVDKTGVGAAVVDLLEDAPINAYLTAVTIHGGDEISHEGRHYRIPKRDLVGALQVLLQTGRLKIAQRLPLAATFTKELNDFRVKISDAGHDSYGAWREGQHDDLVLAVALACWRAENPPPKLWVY